MLILKGIPKEAKYAAGKIDWAAHRRPNLVAADLCSNNVTGPSSNHLKSSRPGCMHAISALVSSDEVYQQGVDIAQHEAEQVFLQYPSSDVEIAQQAH